MIGTWVEEAGKEEIIGHEERRFLGSFELVFEYEICERRRYWNYGLLSKNIYECNREIEVEWRNVFRYVIPLDLTANLHTGKTVIIIPRFSPWVYIKNICFWPGISRQLDSLNICRESNIKDWRGSMLYFRTKIKHSKTEYNYSIVTKNEGSSNSMIFIA